MNNYLSLVEKISTYVMSLFNQYQVNDLMYHNVEHTKTVVKRTLEIAGTYPFSEAEFFILLAAAWFHDSGYLFTTIEKHEEKSVSIMHDYLKEKGVKNEVIARIEECILATKLPHHPHSLLSEILCDADTYHLGTKEFIRTDALIKKEFQLRNIPVDNWEEKTLELLLSHKYFTPYCQVLLNNGKAKNIEIIRKLLKLDGDANN